MIVTHYGRLGPTDDGPSDSPYAQFSPTRGMHQLRGYYSTGPSRTQSPQFGGPGAGAGAWRMCAAALRIYGSAQQPHVHCLPAGLPACVACCRPLLSATHGVSAALPYHRPSALPCAAAGAADDDSDRHHLFASGRPAGWGSAAGQPQQVELMERTGLRAAASYIEERLRRRGGSSQQEPGDQPSSSGGPAGDAGAEGSASFAFFNRAPLFGGGDGSSGGSGASTSQAAALASAGGRQLLQWKDSLLHKLKKASSQPALAVPLGAGPSSMQQLGQAAVASAPLALTGGSPDPRQERQPLRQPLRQRPAAAGVRKAD